jgi:hypothetical protein
MTLLMLVLAANVHAQTPEGLRSAADVIFQNGITAPLPAPILKENEEQEGKKQLGEFLNQLGKPPTNPMSIAAVKEPASYLRLSEVRNNYQNSAASFPLNGRSATVSFCISRSQNAFMSVLGQDGGLSWVNIKSLLDDDKGISVNGRSYTVSLSANIFDKLNSKIRIKGNGESRSFSLRDLINAAFAKGFVFPIGQQEYRVFYYDDVSDNGGYGSSNVSRQDVVLVARDKDDFSIFVVNAEEVPAGQIAVYTLANGARAGLQKLENGSVLAMYPNP